MARGASNESRHRVLTSPAVKAPRPARTQAHLVKPCTERRGAVPDDLTVKLFMVV